MAEALHISGQREYPNAVSRKSVGIDTLNVLSLEAVERVVALIFRYKVCTGQLAGTNQ